MTRELSTFHTSDELSLRYVVDDYTPPWRKAETETLILLHAAMGTHERLYATGEYSDASTLVVAVCRMAKSPGLFASLV